MDQHKRSRLFAGLMLIAFGVVVFFVQDEDFFSGKVLEVSLGGLFLAGYLFTRNYGLLIPACLLIGLGSGRLLASSFHSVDEGWTVGLGAGFVAIYVIALLYERKTHWWPLIPGGVLIVTGLSTSTEIFRFITSRGWPLILVAVGVLILVGAFGRPKRSTTPRE